MDGRLLPLQPLLSPAAPPLLSPPPQRHPAANRNFLALPVCPPRSSGSLSVFVLRGHSVLWLRSTRTFLDSVSPTRSGGARCWSGSVPMDFTWRSGTLSAGPRLALRGKPGQRGRNRVTEFGWVSLTRGGSQSGSTELLLGLDCCRTCSLGFNVVRTGELRWTACCSVFGSKFNWKKQTKVLLQENPTGSQFRWLAVTRSGSRLETRLKPDS